MNFYHAPLLLVEYVIFMHTDAQKKSLISSQSSVIQELAL